MCGICGKLAFDKEEKVPARLVKRMADTIQHRGPDDEGFYVEGQIGLGFRRLSIIDLQSGHQPLSNEDGTVWIVFNGEIYNYQELRAFLINKGHVFRTRTDTEVIVHLYEELGPGCIDRLRGMFGFAIWDANTKTLLLARDRVGIKPLYYALNDKALVFGSEIKAILADESVIPEMDVELIDRFLTFLYMPGEETLLKGIRKLAPGHYLLVKNGRPEVRRYWDLQFTGIQVSDRIQRTEENLLNLLSETVKLHMIADVPVGVLLSGGVDSTGVLSFAAEQTEKTISTFTVGFAGSEVTDERPYAKMAADAFRTQHYEMTISARDFASFLPKYVWHMEEPVCEPPAIAMYYVSRLARQYVTVLLSGEGGDEAFAGYSNYRNLVWLERMKRGGAALNGVLARSMSFADSVLGMRRLKKYVPLMGESFPDYYYSRTANPHRIVSRYSGAILSDGLRTQINRERSIEPIRILHNHVRNQSTLDAMLYIDTKSWLPDDLLIKADKMTMANSIELRVPLLDHKVLEFAASLRSNLKLRGLTTKYILKKTLSKRIPDGIRKRKKVGFPVPYGSWLRNDLKEVVWDVLTDGKTMSRGHFSRSAIQSLLQANSNGSDYSKDIFSLLALELWQRTFVEREEVVL